MHTPDGQSPPARPDALSKRQIIVWSVVLGAVLLAVLARQAFAPLESSRPAAPQAQVQQPERQPVSVPAKPSATPASSAALLTREEIAGWTSAQREARMREVCRDDGHCNSAAVYELLKASTGAETARLEKACLEGRNGAVRRARALLVQLRDLTHNGGGQVGSVDDVRAELNAMAGDFSGVASLRMAAGNVRACLMSGEASQCGGAAALLRDAEKELQELQRPYCALK